MTRNVSQKARTMAVRKGKFTSVMLRLPNDIVARLQARHGCGKSLYAIARDVVSSYADYSLIDCKFEVAEFTNLELLAHRIGFAGIEELLHHLAVAYLQMYYRHRAADGNEIVEEEVREMFADMSMPTADGMTITTTPRKVKK